MAVFNLNALMDITDSTERIIQQAEQFDTPQQPSSTPTRTSRRQRASFSLEEPGLTKPVRAIDVGNHQEQLINKLD